MTEQEIVEQVIGRVQSGEMTVGELLTINAMYPANHTDAEIEVVRQALRLIEQQKTCSAS